jgi:elongator complex protein 3
LATKLEEASRVLAQELLKRGSQISAEELEGLRREVCRRFRLERMLGNADILRALPQEARDRFRPLLRVKPVRSASGVSVVSVMAQPFPCPHGVCLYCPGGVSWGTPQSYVGTEPSARRAAENRYDPYRQVKSRIKQLEATGHRVSKVELIILGGTFLAAPLEYQYWFVKGCFEGLNGARARSLEEAQHLNEVAEHRCIGLTVETRPDYCKEPHVDRLLYYGATRVEVGVQALSDDIYRLVNRGHTVQDVVEAFQVARDAGFKIGAHMMLGLPGATPSQDLEHFTRLFEDERFKPDTLKIYPTLVVEGTGLYRWLQEGRYRPYPAELVAELLVEVKRRVPEWVRIVRIQREIPAYEIVEGVRWGNLRELVRERMWAKGLRCRCIRCREVGLRRMRLQELRSIRLVRREYTAAGGREVFLAFEDEETDTLVGFLRLRLPSAKAHREEVRTVPTALVRELHVYGDVVPVGAQEARAWQHRGYGRRLLQEAERVAREEWGVDRLLVISGVGVREYYRRLGYRRVGPYMGKPL